MIVQTYKVSTINGEAILYDAGLEISDNLAKFYLCTKQGKPTAKWVAFPIDNIIRLETWIEGEDFDKNEEGGLVINNEQFISFSKTVEAYDEYLNQDDEDFDPDS
jgi:hypothetical protein